VVGVGSCRPTHPGSIPNRDVPVGVAPAPPKEGRQKRPLLLWSGVGENSSVQKKKCAKLSSQLDGHLSLTA
jgi:hypothetical protein